MSNDRKTRHMSHLPEEDYALQIFDDPTILEHFDIFEVVFTKIARFTLLPELLRIFGPENLLQFLDIFKGTKIECPSPTVLHEIARDVIIFLRLEDDASDETMRYLQVRYELDRDRINKIHKRVEIWLQATGKLPARSSSTDPAS